ncbi:PAS domain S-box protein [Mesorhizobium sp. Z1-4]|uniref:PAS domain S-box protein n=1 Tax=Mesorhizobium sp. Z1-4 TaxID=2448478 RepID=UPI000FD70502|nr:PAS domain S-box protein [Mesorhizobium sp. Z1-4]
MPPRSYSYLDVSALDGVREKIVEGAAALVLPATLDEVIWANGAGAALFGHSGVATFVGGDPEFAPGAKRQITATPGFPAVRSGRPIAVRLAKGVSSQTVMFQAETVALPDGEKAILLSVPDPLADTRTAEERAGRAIAGLATDGGGVALVDATGRITAASRGFDGLGISAGTLEGLAVEVAGEADRLVKRLVPTSKGELPAGIVRLADVPALSLLMIANDAEEAADETAGDADGGETAAAPPEESAETEPGGSQASRIDPGSHAETSEAGSDGTDGDNEPEAPVDTAPATEGVVRGTGEDKWYFGSNGAQAAASSTDSQKSPAATETAASGDTIDADEIDTKVAGETADMAAAPLRFVWRTDAEAKFSALSDEFRQAFGAEATDIVGRDFADVAEAFALDPDGEIAGLMNRRDTWSGRSVLWPIAGTDLVAPVDLAALPVYGRDGTFEGFRGFGIARMGDAVVDDHARGLQLVGALPETDDAGEVETIVAPADFAAEDDDPFKGETPALAIEQSRERRENDKVIRLAERRNQQPPKGLSSAEQETFQEIGKRLKDASNLDEDAEARDDAAAAEEAESDTSSDIGSNEAHGLIAGNAGDADTGDEAEEPSAEATASAAEERSPGDHSEDTVPANSDETSEPVEAKAAEGSNAVTGEADAAEGETDGDVDAVAETPGDSPDDTISEVDAPARDRQDAAADAEVTPSGETENASAEAVESPEAEAPAAVEATSGDNTQDQIPDGGAEGEEQAGETTGSDDAPSADASDEMPAVNDATRDADGDDAAPGNGELAASSEAAPEPAGSDAGASAKRKVGLSAFLPSAFSVGGIVDASVGIDSTVLSRLPLPLLIHSGDELHYANREFLTLTGYRSLAEFDLAGGMDAIFAGSYEADGTNGQTLKLRARDGDEFPVHAFLQSIGWQGGKALLLALRRADPPEPSPQGEPIEAGNLETQLDELRTIIDTATDGVVIIGNDGTIRSVSKPAEALFGYNENDLPGRPFTSLFAIESQRPAREYLDGLAGNGVASVLNDGREVIGREAQGRFIPLFMTIGRLPHESGFCAVLRDITHWKRAEEELTEARAAAERASSQKTEFLARVSHEIRTPLNAIIGFSELMIDEKFGPIGSERYRDYLSDINRSGNHVLDLVNDLLDISKIEAGQQELSYEAVSLNDVLSEAVAMMQPQANRERVIIRSSFASSLPDVVADLRSIRQIALNLLSNAIRYTPAGGQVVVSTVYEAGDIAMRVRDTGVGMAAADIEQALKPFKQINALKRPRGDGTGLGLPLTKAMVEANRARFTIQSTPGEGTLVEITFPSTRVLAD